MQKQNTYERKLTMKVDTLKIIVFILFAMFTSSQIILCTQFKGGPLTLLSNNSQQSLKLNNTFNYFKKNIIETTQSEFNASSLLEEMYSNLRAPKFNDLKNKKERWQQNVDCYSATEDHMKDIIEYVQNSMMTQSNMELKTLLSDSQYDFLFVLKVGKSYLPSVTYKNRQQLTDSRHGNHNQWYDDFIGRVTLIQQLIQKQPELLRYKETFNFKELFIWPKWPLLLFRYFFQKSVCDDAMFSEFIRLCYDCDRQENSNWPSKKESGMLQSFSSFYQELENKEGYQYLNGHTPKVPISLSNVTTDQVKSLVTFFENSPFFVIEQLIRINYTIDFIACLHKISKWHVAQATEVERIIAKNDFRRVKNQFDTMMQNVQITCDSVYVNYDIDKYLLKKRS